MLRPQIKALIDNLKQRPDRWAIEDKVSILLNEAFHHIVTAYEHKETIKITDHNTLIIWDTYRAEYQQVSVSKLGAHSNTIVLFNPSELCYFLTTVDYICSPETEQREQKLLDSFMSLYK